MWSWLRDVFEWLCAGAGAKFTCSHCGERLPVGPSQPVRGMCCVCVGFTSSIPRGARFVTPPRQAPMGKTGPTVTPFAQRWTDPAGKGITISVAFNDTTRVLGSTTVTRDVGCQYSTVLIGLGADGTPGTTPHNFTVPTGTTVVTAGQLAANGLSVIEDVLNLQMTVA